MRYLLLLVALLLGSLVLAQGINLDTGNRLEFTNCLAAGGDGGTVHAGQLVEGTYLLRVTGEDTFVCEAAYSATNPDGCADGGVCWSCATGGEKYPTGTVMLLSVARGGRGYSCRSAGATGDVIFTRAN